MIKMVGTIRWSSVRFWTRHTLERSKMCVGLRRLAGRGGRRTVSRMLCIAVIGISFVLITDDIFHSAPDPDKHVVGLRHSRAAERHRPDSDDDVYQQLQALLSTVNPRARCQQQAKLGGRCYICGLSTDDLLEVSEDGRKPICIDLLRRNCTVLSFGINNDFTFDDAMEDLGCTVHAFDPTMGVGSFRRSNGIHFHDVGIGAEDSQLGGFLVASLGTIVRQIGLRSRIIDYMKLDVESSEWGMLEQQLAISGDLLRVKQLAIEFHLWRWSPVLTDGVGMQTENKGSLRISGENARRFVNVLNGLKAAGFILTHTMNHLLCQPYEYGCLSVIYETVWVNTKLRSLNAKLI